jgi:hypothetical protein
MLKLVGRSQAQSHFFISPDAWYCSSSQHALRADAAETGRILSLLIEIPPIGAQASRGEK